jgi:hypothetical protein
MGPPRRRNTNTHPFFHFGRWLRIRRIALLLALFSVITFYLPTWLSHQGYRFPVGVYVTVMGVVSAIMALHEGPTKWEKAGWILFITALMVGEIRNLYTADRDQAKTFSQISNSLDATKKELDATADGIRNSISQGQEQFNITMDRVGKTLEASEAAQRNTQPHADLELSHIDVFGRESPLLRPNDRLGLNIHYNNIGNDFATQVLLDAKEYVGPLDSVSFQTTIGKDFDQWWSTTPHKDGGLAANGQKPFFTINTHAFTQEEIQAIVAHSNTIYVLTRWSYHDRNGHWIGDNCGCYQDPTHDFIVAHECSVHNNHRYRAP